MRTRTLYGGSALLLLGIVAVSVNLRPAAVSVGPVLGEIRDGLGLSAGGAGLLTSLPVIAFAVFGASAPRIAHHLGLHRTTLLGMVLVTGGLATRSFVESGPPFLLLSVIALAGMAMANVLLPSLIKLHYPDRVGSMTAIYTTAMAIGLTVASMATVPMGEALGSWRWGLLVWAGVAAIGILPWLGLMSHDLAPADEEQPITMAQVARTPLGWAMVLCFGLQSTQAYVMFGWLPEIYRGAGYDATEAGLFLGIATGISIPLSFWLPASFARTSRPVTFFMVLMGCYITGYLGLLLMIDTLPWLWALILGTGACVFPLVLTLIGLRARTAAGTRALSGFTQSAGYLVAAPGPWLFGVLHESSGGWTVPLLAVLALILPLAVCCVYVARPHFLEDQLA